MNTLANNQPNAAQSGDRTRLIRLVQVGRRTLGLDEETYRALLELQSGKRSAAELTIQELDKVLLAMKGAGFKPTVKRPVKAGGIKRLSPARGAHAKTAEINVIRAVWITMHRHGLLRDGSETALNHYVERQTVRLNNGIGVAEVAWLTDGLAYQVLESLKNWHKREMVARLVAAKKTVPTNGKSGRVAGYQAVVAAFEEMSDGR
ncbi:MULTISPECIES: gp16 family protein [Aeromonas]|uniref:gp16 family protein n=1 Tax=Aeromonas TaxID=642 RepID=UPI000CD10CC4|nr:MULTISPECIES: regulatory protein GemA [Aeromonas]AUT41463.1 regulatory protein GemA [Aeromonas sp. ASNIH5]MCR3965705.1 regulatory protein GemA [Aeromonas veronii]MCR3978181.1 regulatory protein GemA [Aeromonas veronii]QXC33708.1 regulatory protein GemA [Aeromonas sp. FDAARGOS 1407]BBT20739.1 GemA protein [Aeromonas caviae]